MPALLVDELLEAVDGVVRRTLVRRARPLQQHRNRSAISNVKRRTRRHTYRVERNDVDERGQVAEQPKQFARVRQAVVDALEHDVLKCYATGRNNERFRGNML